MKLQSGWVGAGLLLLSAGLTPALAETFRPERGVRCETVERVCYERGAPSVEYTREHFGPEAARALRRESRWEGRGESGWEERGRSGRVFFPEPGVRCDRVAEVCTNRRGEPSVRLTREHLGYQAARRLEWQRDR